MSKAQLTAFMVKVDADTALRARVDAAGSVDAVVAIALEQGHAFLRLPGPAPSASERSRACLGPGREGGGLVFDDADPPAPLG